MSGAGRKSIQTSTLIDLGYLSQEQVDNAEAEASTQSMDPIALLRKNNVVSDAQLHHAFARDNGWEFIDLTKLDFQSIPEDIIDLVPAGFARSKKVIPYGRSADALKVAVTNPSDIGVANEIRGTIVGTRVDLVYAAPNEITKAVSKVYSATKEASSVIKKRQREGMGEKTTAARGGDLGLVLSGESSNVKAVDLIIEQAILDGVSDIHIQPEKDFTTIRYRIDDILTTQSELPRVAHEGIVNRIKVLAKLNTDNNRTPQDGRISDLGPARDMGLRVAVLPTSTGERITMRVLDNKKAAEPLAALGFTEYNLERYRKAFTQPSGLVMITGPTGSGKSTTLYSTFNELLTDTKNFMTAEDPVEYQIQGISQIEVNEDQGMTFAKIMKSFKRSDPNVMLLGEIRDRETAVLGLDIALTGHLLFTTIHADDAPGGISSLIKQDVNPFLVASALDCVVAQRLMRKVCSVCAISYDASQEEIKLLNLKRSIELPGIKKARPGGCEACRYQGYKGRFAVHEVLLMDNELRDLVSRGNATPTELTDCARKGGMEPMLRDGIRRLVSGDTTIDEIARTIKTSQLIDIEN